MTEHMAELTVKPRSVLVFYGRTEPISQELAEQLARSTNCDLIVNLTAGQTLESLDDAAMEARGWVRK